MKLNLGCGRYYKAGYVNIDAYDTTVADLIMDATDLDFQDNSVEIIEAYQLIEHFGYIRSFYALSEWFRVLEPKGTLIIETPDLETSFKKYIKGSRKIREGLLFWIYGCDETGMEHRFGFPFFVIESLLNTVGFVRIKKKKFVTFRNEPVLQVICEKPQRFQPFQIIAKYRKELKNKKIVDINERKTGEEKLINFFFSVLKKYLEQRRTEFLDDMVIEGAIHSPIMVNLFLKELLRQKLIEEKEIKNLLEAIENLHNLNLPNLLFHSLKNSPTDTGEQKKIFNATLDSGRGAIKKLLYSSEEEKILEIKSLSKLYEEYKNEEQIDFFSEEVVKQKSDILLSCGIKFFSLQRYKEAINKFREAISLYRNNPSVYWNLARALVSEGKHQEAIESYESSLKLGKYFHPAQSNEFVQKLKNELKLCYSNLRRETPHNF